ncbi:hypothetical protein [Streptomyces sp. NPDC058045]|uniref:hypothetical protein n=1 Tax=Streptomyces sp. NPDC058045 TaxID=3346311 RepID=UPI0036E7D70D
MRSTTRGEHPGDLGGAEAERFEVPAPPRQPQPVRALPAHCPAASKSAPGAAT